jgi:hypothetical protein
MCQGAWITRATDFTIEGKTFRKHRREGIIAGACKDLKVFNPTSERNSADDGPPNDSCPDLDHLDDAAEHAWYDGYDRLYHRASRSRLANPKEARWQFT